MSKDLKTGFIKFLFILAMTVGGIFSVNAQSSSQNFPTPITANEISGTIKARDIGDSRLTAYFYTFNGNQGDVFINVVTNNFNGDIDIFAVEGLRPLTKIVVYADSSINETGRVIYLRKPEKILMRIEGRSPNDDPATFQIKFAGSFAPSTDIAASDEQKPPEVEKKEQGEVIVNSVGTIIGIRPKPTPEPKAVEEIVEKKADEVKADDAAAVTEEKTEDEKKEEPEETAQRPKLEVVITDNLETKPPESEEKPADEEKVLAETEKPKDAEEKPTDETKKAETVEPTETKKEREARLLGNIRLVVIFKDGGRIERPMNEILKFGVEKTTLTIIHKNGTIGRYSIFDIEKITIE